MNDSDLWEMVVLWSNANQSNALSVSGVHESQHGQLKRVARRESKKWMEVWVGDVCHIPSASRRPHPS